NDSENLKSLENGLKDIMETLKIPSDKSKQTLHAQHSQDAIALVSLVMSHLANKKSEQDSKKYFESFVVTKKIVDHFFKENSNNPQDWVFSAYHAEFKAKSEGQDVQTVKKVFLKYLADKSILVDDNENLDNIKDKIYKNDFFNIVDYYLK